MELIDRHFTILANLGKVPLLTRFAISSFQGKYWREENKAGMYSSFSIV